MLTSTVAPPLGDASRFGVVTVTTTVMCRNLRRNLASSFKSCSQWGLHFKKWSVLREELLTLKDQPGCDFGKHVIPYIHEKNHKAYVYEFNGYWKDVELWEAHRVVSIWS